MTVPVDIESAPSVPNLGRLAQLSDEVAAYGRDLIMSGHVKAGEFLRLEKLAADLGVSATPVREGLLRLRGEGFVELVARRGFMVSPLSKQDVMDIFMVQADISGELAARAARLATAAEVDSIEEIQRRLEEKHSPHEVSAVAQLNHQFHRAVNKCAASDKLTWLLRPVSRYTPRAFFGEIVGWQQASIADHRDVLTALTNRDEDAARAAARYHIIHAGGLLVRYLEEEVHFWNRAADDAETV